MMGGGSIDDDLEFTAPLNGLRTLVLVGRTGNGKSATGNSILGTNEFLSRASSAGVTSTSELRKTVLKDGQMLNVIDTPGLFDSSLDTEFIGKEIVKCINMAREGIHAVLVVLSVRNRFSKEEEAAISSLRTLFGNKLNDYMIVVFTGGDELEENEQTLEDFLGDCPVPLKWFLLVGMNLKRMSRLLEDFLGECPVALKETLNMCGGRCVIFDNRTRDQMKKKNQVHKLLFLVNMVLTKNNGKPYTNEIFSELKRGAMKLHEQTEQIQALRGYSKQEIFELTEKMSKSSEEQLQHVTEMVEAKLKEMSSRIEKNLVEEQIARLKFEEMAESAQKQAENEIFQLRVKLERAEMETEEIRRRLQSGYGNEDED